MSSLQPILDAILSRSRNRDRILVAVAGPPGAGKSTIAHTLAQYLPDQSAKVVPMDGFHYDNAVLNELGLRGRKGSPETFDFEGFALLLQRIRRMDCNIAIPVFDREADLARAGACLITRAVKFIISEGNYLLLDEEPWLRLEEYFDFTIFLDVPQSELKRRLVKRWMDLGDPEQKAEQWVMSNDMPNVDRVLSRRRSADLIWRG